MSEEIVEGAPRRRDTRTGAVFGVSAVMRLGDMDRGHAARRDDHALGL